MSMAGGWFFLMVNEAFVLGDKDFRLPGLGSYMSVAAAKGDRTAMLWAMLAMVLMIIVLDQLVWRPVVGLGAEVPGRGERLGGRARRVWFYDSSTPRASSRPCRAGSCGCGKEAVESRARRPPGRRACARRRRRALLGLASLRGSSSSSSSASPSAASRSSRCSSARRAPSGRELHRRALHPRARLDRDRARHPLGPAGRPRDRPLAGVSRIIQPIVQIARVVPRADALPGRDRRPRGGRHPARLGQHRADAARHAVVHPLQRHRRRRRASRPTCARPRRAIASPAGRRLRSVYLPGGVPVPGHRLGHGGRRRLERQHRRRVRHLPRDRSSPRAASAPTSASPPSTPTSRARRVASPSWRRRRRSSTAPSGDRATASPSSASRSSK